MLLLNTVYAGLAVITTAVAVQSPTQLGDVSILAENSLISNDTAATSAALLLGKVQPLIAAQSACNDLGETLWSPRVENFTAGLNNSLAYEVYTGRYSSEQSFWIAQKGRISTCRPSDTLCQAMGVNGSIYNIDCSTNLPVLCTQSAPASNISFANTSTAFQIQQTVGSQSFIGFRDFFTFRFLGIRFAEEPARFSYSRLFNGSGTSEALHPAPQCLQTSANPNPLPTFNNLSDSTDCLFLNVFTTKLPATEKPASEALKPVMVYIYGGTFCGKDFDEGITKRAQAVLLQAPQVTPPTTVAILPAAAMLSWLILRTESQH